jgi:diguanylate cyclase (GGDEF)-like protein
LGELDADQTESIVQAGTVAEKIRAVLAEIYRLKTHDMNVLEHHCTSSIGVTLFTDHENSATEVLKLADMAMYQAKAAGRNIVRFYEPDK